MPIGFLSFLTGPSQRPASYLAKFVTGVSRRPWLGGLSGPGARLPGWRRGMVQAQPRPTDAGVFNPGHVEEGNIHAGFGLNGAVSLRGVDLFDGTAGDE